MIQTGTQVAKAFCPDCKKQIDVGVQPKLDRKVTCPGCWAKLEVIRLKPLKLNWDTAYLAEDRGIIKDWQRYQRIQYDLI